MNPQFVSTISEEPSWLMSNLWWLALVGIVVLTIIWGGSKAILAGMIFGIIQLLPPGLDQSTPEATALGYAQAMARLDIQTAKKYLTPEAARTFESVEALTAMMPQKAKDKALEDSKFLVQARCTVSADGDAASCTVCCTPSGDTNSFTNEWGNPTVFIKVNGKWYAQPTKEASSNPIEPTPTPEPPPNQ